MSTYVLGKNFRHAFAKRVVIWMECSTSLEGEHAEAGLNLAVERVWTTDSELEGINSRVLGLGWNTGCELEGNESVFVFG